MRKENRGMFLFMSALLLCTLICGLRFYDNSDISADTTLISTAAIVTANGGYITVLSPDGETLTQYDISGKDITPEELKLLRDGISVNSEEELESIIEDYVDR